MLVLQALMVGMAAWLVWRWIAPGAQGAVESMTGLILLAIALVVAGGVLLGHAGWLGRATWFLGNVVMAATLLLARRDHLRADIRSFGALMRAGAGPFGALERSLLLLLSTLLMILAALAALAEPVVYDALAVRLPRIGYWLQTGGLGPIGASDPRLDYMPFGPDLMMAWFIAPFDQGWRPAALAQWTGGVLLLISTVGMARQLGLSRVAALGAAFFVAGMANVAPQFTSTHSDLFTAGVLAAGFFLWWRAVAREQGSIAAGIGVGLALGSKGTVFYLAPGLMLWIFFIGRWRSSPRGMWRQTILAACAAGAIYAVPNYYANWRSFGGVFGPADHVAQHHNGAFVDKLTANLPAALLQLADPSSQPWPLGEALRRPASWLAGKISDTEDLVWMGYRRRSTLGSIFARENPDADVTSFGLLPVLLALTAIPIAIRSGGADSRLVVAILAGLAVAFLFFTGMQRWHPFGYRYMVLAAPWLAIIMAWALENYPPALRRSGWIICVGASLLVLVQQNLWPHQSGWRAVWHPGGSASYHHAQAWSAWAEGFEAGSRLAVALPYNRPLAGFFRGPKAMDLHFKPVPDEATAEDAARRENGWLIVAATHYLGREGRVVTRTWLDNGDETSPFSLAAYRVLQPGEISEVAVYRVKKDRRGDTRHWSLLIGNPTTASVRLDLANEGPQSVVVKVTTPLQRREIILSPSGEAGLLLELASGRVSELLIEHSQGEDTLRVRLNGAELFSPPAQK